MNYCFNYRLVFNSNRTCFHWSDLKQSFHTSLHHNTTIKPNNIMYWTTSNMTSIIPHYHWYTMLYYTTHAIYYTYTIHKHHTHTNTLNCAHSLFVFLQVHQLTPNIVNTIPPHHDTQCWQQLNITNILQSLIIQVNNTQQHLLTLLHNMEDDYSE